MTFPEPRPDDVRASLVAFLVDSSGILPTVIPGTTWPAKDLDDFVMVEVAGWDPVPIQEGGAPFIRGELRVDVFSRMSVDGSPGSFGMSNVHRVVGDLGALFTSSHLPVFATRDFIDGGGLVGTLASPITAGATSLTVTGGAAFGSSPQEITVGVERIAWTSKVDAGADATFSGLTRGVGITSAAAHVASSPVADGLGAEVGVVDFFEPSARILGRDQALHRTRGLVEVPFRVSYTEA